MITLSKQEKVAAWSLLVLPTISTEISNSPQPTTIKSSLESLDPLTGSPSDSSLPSSPFPFLMITTTSGTILTGKYPNTLLFTTTPVPTPTSLEKNPSAPAPVATTAAPLTLPNTTTTLNETVMSTPYNSSINHPHPFYSPSPKPSQLPTSPQYQPSPIPRCQSPLPISKKSSSPKVISHQKDQETQMYLRYTPPPYPHPVTITTQVKEHYPNPKQFLNVFHHTLDSLYTDPLMSYPWCVQRKVPHTIHTSYPQTQNCLHQRHRPIPGGHPPPSPTTEWQRVGDPCPHLLLTWQPPLNPIPHLPGKSLSQKYQNHWYHHLWTGCWNGISGDVIPTWNRTFRLGIVSDHCAVKNCANDIILTADW